MNGALLNRQAKKDTGVLLKDMKESRGMKAFRIFNLAFLLVVVFLTVYPFLNIIAQSFSSEGFINSGQVNLFPRGFNVETYKLILADSTFWNNYGNTVLYTVVATAISMVLTTTFAYAIAKKDLKGRSFFIGIAVFTMFFNGGLIPNYVLISSLGMRDSIWAVVLPNAISVFNLLIMKSFFENMPRELEEAAAIDGLTQYGVLFRVVLPLSKAIVATMVLFYAVANWNSWFQAFLYLDKPELFPVTIYLRNMIAGASNTASAGSTVENVGQIAANIQSVTIVLTVIPILCVYPFVQKYFFSGIMLGSVKE
ncbi:putative aldouronate transport system permease protein [Arthrobacter pascens]|uniref:carbohydrate ABC transporter permease n=1 Tax=Arthrobacter pascens TaxID=1677 RepID=UPI00278DDEA0|nr:carbohydrate ABC transporter permease [Arthrobacter pascens]MDQ0679838.1 putative aldouronate transport system permease protein [Arthrobacter pascens]